jgi:hypothetical protein
MKFLEITTKAYELLGKVIQSYYVLENNACIIFGTCIIGICKMP